MSRTVLKRVMLICIALLFTYIAVNGVIAKVWYIRSISFDGGFAIVNFAQEVKTPAGTVWAEYSNEKRDALSRIFTPIPGVREVKIFIGGVEYYTPKPIQ